MSTRARGEGRRGGGGAGRSGRARAIQPPFTFNERVRSLARLFARFVRATARRERSAYENRQRRRFFAVPRESSEATRGKLALPTFFCWINAWIVEAQPKGMTRLLVCLLTLHRRAKWGVDRVRRCMPIVSERF